MKRALIALPATLMAASILMGQEPAASTQATGFGGNLFMGTRGLDNSNYLGLIDEYDIAPQGLRPSLGGSIWGQKGGFFLDARGEHRGDGRNQQYFLRMDATRYFRLRTTYDRYVYRLDHDTLDNLDAAKGSVVLRHNDFQPGVQYIPGRSELRTTLTGAVPGLPALRWKAAHRTQLEHGGVQARTLSKCANCHVTSVTKKIDQRQHEVSGGLMLQVSRFLLEYEYRNRQFNERGATPVMQYDAAIHPATLQNVFGNRVAFDTKQGLLPYSQVADGRKSAHELKARVDLPKDGRLSGAFVRSRAENKYSGLGIDTTGWSSKFTMPLKKWLTFTARVRKLDVESDDVFVDINEPVSGAGPQAGLTYAQGYPTFGSTDFWRYSVASRSQVRAESELSARLARLTTLRAGYQYKHLKRDHYEVDQTATNRVFAAFSTRRSAGAAGDWTARVRYTMERTRDPFLHHKAALSPALQTTPSPGSPPSPILGTQYFTLYQARQADLTNQPTSSHGVDPSVSWMPNGRVSLTAHYRVRSDKNDKLNYSSWERDVHMPGAELWIAPAEKLNFTVAYTFHNEKSVSLFVLPAFDG